MIVFSKTLVNARADVDSILSNFCVDPQVQVRAAVAGVFHEVIVSLGKDAGSIVQSEFITLLRDDCVEVGRNIQTIVQPEIFIFHEKNFECYSGM
jgi:hypothetical protein